MDYFSQTVSTVVDWLADPGWKEEEIYNFVVTVLVVSQVSEYGFIFLFWAVEASGLFEGYRNNTPSRSNEPGLENKIWWTALCSRFPAHVGGAVIYVWFTWCYRPLTQDIGSCWVFFAWVAFHTVVAEVCQYTKHLLLHHPNLYVYHKTHHEVRSVMPEGGKYIGRMEILASIFGIYLLPISACRLVTHVLDTARPHALIWIFMVIKSDFEHAELHSGYTLPFTPIQYLPGYWGYQLHHEYHHTNQYNYAHWPVLDHLFGTTYVPQSKSS